jgi:copper chaperone CopZ
MRYIITTVLILSILLGGCSSSNNSFSGANTIDASSVKNLQEVTLEIEGIFCASCSLGVEAQLREVEGVVDAEVSLEEGKGYVTYDGDIVDAQTIAKASTVYPARVIEK